MASNKVEDKEDDETPTIVAEKEAENIGEATKEVVEEVRSGKSVRRSGRAAAEVVIEQPEVEAKHRQQSRTRQKEYIADISSVDPRASKDSPVRSSRKHSMSRCYGKNKTKGNSSRNAVFDENLTDTTMQASCEPQAKKARIASSKKDEMDALKEKARKSPQEC